MVPRHGKAVEYFLRVSTLGAVSAACSRPRPRRV